MLRESLCILNIVLIKSSVIIGFILIDIINHQLYNNFNLLI